MMLMNQIKQAHQSWQPNESKQSIGVQTLKSECEPKHTLKSVGLRPSSESMSTAIAIDATALVIAILLQVVAVVAAIVATNASKKENKNKETEKEGKRSRETARVLEAFTQRLFHLP